MSSPFPGMNPYLEHPNIWEDFHANLAMEIQAQLSPNLRPRYYAALVPRVTYEEVLIEEKHSIKPDVSVYKVSDLPWGGQAVAIAPAPVSGEVALELPVKQYTIEIRKTGTNVLVTAIEILSPVNKRPAHEAFEEYQRKRRDLFRSAAHLMEIDLLRGGERPPLVTPRPPAPYFVMLSRVERRPKVDLWPLRLPDPIPVMPAPLSAPDPDVPLDLGKAIHTIYDRASYDLRIDYRQPPPRPDLEAEDRAWLESHLQAAGVR